MTRSLPALPQPGERIDRYEVLAEIAHGGMAAVYAARLAHKSGVNKLLALKVLLPHLAADERFVTMFLDEARIASRIDHPNVVQLFEVGEHDGRPFLVMELLRGHSLSALVRRASEEGGLPTSRLLAILADVARGLHGAHEARDDAGRVLGVVHRDVSPQNVHVSYDGRVRVIDFGIAAAAGRVTKTRTDEVKGKLAYMAPEQLHRRDAIDRRTDLWAFGVMAWQALAGAHLFRGDNDADTMFNVLHREVPDIQGKRPDLPDAAADVLMRCLRRAPEERPASAAEVAETLARVADTCPPSEPLAAAMVRLFAKDIATEEERLAAAMRVAPPPPLKEEEHTSGKARVMSEDGTTTTVRRSRGARGAVFAVTALLALAGIAAGSWYALVGHGDTATVPPVPELAADDAPRTAPPPVPAPPVPAPPPAADDTRDVAPSAPATKRRTHRSHHGPSDHAPAEGVAGHGGLLPVPL